ncbi:MAG: SIS domain-containing protein [Chloroflexi bacterium]|nr:SIS domain-containing protein [Chloroflexota bacterium]
MTFLQQEIYDQPAAIRRLLQAETGTVATVARAIRDFDPTFVMIAARGTSDNAARYAQYLMGIKTGLPVALATPSVFTLYDAAPTLARALVIGISQSGGSEDIRRVIEGARSQGALTLAITNTPSSPLAETVAYHLYLNAGKEQSVAATKTYTTELTAIAMLVTALTDQATDQETLLALPNWVEQTLHMSDPIASWIERYRYANHIASIGRGYNYCTAFEISLKIKELCYITGEEYSEADFRHGPIAIIQPGFPVIVVAPQGKPLPLQIDLLKKLKEKAAECLVISNVDDLAGYAQKMMPLPDKLPEWISPVCAVIPGQCFAMHLAQAKGHAIDTPEGLQKVTNTV